jgi:intracellular multiplication protein IcmL
MSNTLESSDKTTETFDLSEENIICIHRSNEKNAKQSKLFLSLAALLGVYIVLATLVLVMKASNPPVLFTFLNDQTQSVEFIIPNRNPPVTDRQAIHWARDKVCDLLSLHFKKYSSQISRRKNYFAGEGWSLYQFSLLENNIIETIKEDGLIITAINQDTPRLIQKYLLDGKVNWRIEMPVLQTIQGASDTPSTEKKIVSVTVQEARRDESIEGLKIRIFGVTD